MAGAAGAGLAGLLLTSQLFQKGTKKPKLDPLPEPPSAEAESASAAAGSNAARASERKRAAAGGRASTLLTGASGLTAEPRVERKTLLGL